MRIEASATVLLDAPDELIVALKKIRSAALKESLRSAATND